MELRQRLSEAQMTWTWWRGKRLAVTKTSVSWLDGLSQTAERSKSIWSEESRRNSRADHLRSPEERQKELNKCDEAQPPHWPSHWPRLWWVYWFDLMFPHTVIKLDNRKTMKSCNLADRQHQMWISAPVWWGGSLSTLSRWHHWLSLCRLQGTIWCLCGTFLINYSI